MTAAYTHLALAVLMMPVIVVAILEFYPDYKRWKKRKK